jgi:hypothetical protein
MKTFKYVLIALFIFSAAILGNSVSTFIGSAQSDDQVLACRVLKNLSQSSRNWAEVIAYKNAFDFVKSHVANKGDIADDERYFDRLAQNNSGTSMVFCMYLNKAPKNNCGFRNQETDNLIETIEKKMKTEHLSIADITKAVESAQPINDPKKFSPIKNNR